MRVFVPSMTEIRARERSNRSKASIEIEAIDKDGFFVGAKIHLAASRREMPFKIECTGQLRRDAEQGRVGSQMEIAAGCIGKFRAHRKRAGILLRSNSAQSSIVVVKENGVVGCQIQPYTGVVAEYVVVHDKRTRAAQGQPTGAAH